MDIHRKWENVQFYVRGLIICLRKLENQYAYL